MEEVILMEPLIQQFIYSGRDTGGQGAQLRPPTL